MVVLKLLAKSPNRGALTQHSLLFSSTRDGWLPTRALSLLLTVSVFSLWSRCWFRVVSLFWKKSRVRSRLPKRCSECSARRSVKGSFFYFSVLFSFVFVITTLSAPTATPFCHPVCYKSHIIWSERVPTTVHTILHKSAYRCHISQLYTHIYLCIYT